METIIHDENLASVSEYLDSATYVAKPEQCASIST